MKLFLFTVKAKTMLVQITWHEIDDLLILSTSHISAFFVYRLLCLKP